MTRTDLPRVAQLTQKTNQFNLSLRRRSVADLKALGKASSIFVIEASDRFGDYGLIGVCVLVQPDGHPADMELDTLLMSCRALGRGIEDAVLHDVLSHVKKRGGERLLAPFVPGPRNEPIQSFLRRSGFRETPDNRWTIDSSTELPIPAHLSWHGPDQPVPVLPAG